MDDSFQPIGTLAARVVEKAAFARTQRIEVTDRESWLALRRQDLTASDIAAVAGHDPRRTPLRVYHEKTGTLPPIEDNDIMRRGRWLEASVVEALRDMHPDWEIRRAGVYLRDPVNRFGATPDVVAIDPARDGIGNIQCKVVARPVFEAMWEDGIPPIGYQLQTLGEASLMDASWAMVAALVVDTFSAEYVEFAVERHAGAEARIRRIAADFWANVAAGREPPVTYAADEDLVKTLYPAEQPGKELDLSADNMLPALMAERATLTSLIKTSETRKTAIETEIKAKLGDAEIGTLPGWRVTWKSQTRAEHTVPASTFRVLRVTDRRAKELAQ